MSWIDVRHLPLDLDLAPLAQFLNSRGLLYRFSEANGQQVVSVRDPAMVEPLGQLIDQYLQGQITLPDTLTQAHGQTRPLQGPVGISIWATPVTVLLIILSIVGALLMNTEAGQPWAWYMTFQLMSGVDEFLPLSVTFSDGQYWRLLTPAFLHFSFFHVLFNSLWMWDLGRRLELVMGKAHYIFFFVITAIAANFAQYFWSGSSLFGGMSGVVYALVGYIWIRQRFAPHPFLNVPAGIIGFMLVWLFICMSGVVDYFISGGIANAAHVGGLVAGMVWGACSGVFYAKKSKPSVQS